MLPVSRACCRFYARLTELRNRIRANSMELLTANSEDEAKTSKPKTSSNDLSKSSSSIYGSLPRVASSNSRHLPTLPETGPLVRSMSLKDNSNVDSDAPNSSSTNKPSSPPQSTQSHLSKSPQQQQSVLRRVNSAGGAPQTPLITDLMKPPAPTTTTASTTTTNNNESGVFKVPPTPPKTLDLWYVQNSHTNQPRHE